ncbi:MAG: response regulator [Bacteroidales bacterium]|nr:response regulator [Bacteroidales bacterium]
METLKRILYAEDNANDIELTLTAFKECNLANPVDVVRDGEEVLDYLFYRGKYAMRKINFPAFLLLDLKMPKKDGIDVLKEIRKSKEYKNLPVVILTSSRTETDVIKGYEVGANGFVVKPIDFNDFVKAVKGIGYFWGILNISPQ